MADIDQPDLRAEVGPYYIDLWRGIFRDEVRIWRDVSPALGGLIGRRTCRRGSGVDLYNQAVDAVTNITSRRE